MSEEKTFAKTKPQEKPSNPKDVKFPSIFEAALLIENNYWSDVVKDLSRGRCPKKCMIDDETVSFASKKQKDVIYYKTKSAEDLAALLPEMMTKYCGLTSAEDVSRDMVNVNHHLDAFVKTTELNDWRKVNNKNMKRDLIAAWVSEQKTEHDYKWATARKLFRSVCSAFFVLHTHSGDDVQMEDGKISSIGGIEVRDGLVINSKLQTKIDEAAKNLEEEVDKRKTVVDKWVSYLKGMTDRDITC